MHRAAAPRRHAHGGAALLAAVRFHDRLALPGDQVASLDFMVRDDNREHARAALNERLLRDLAEQTGGAYFPLGQLGQLPPALTERTARLTSLREVDLWSSPLFFALLILLITTEWIIRKVSELK